MRRYWLASRSSSQAIWMDSSLPSLESFGSPAKPSSSVTHLCKSVKRTPSGSMSGNFSASLIPISSQSSQSNVAGMLAPSSPAPFPQRGGALVFSFLGEIAIPLRDLHHHVGGPVRDALTAQARFRGKPRRLVELIVFRVGRFVARLEAFVHDHVARGAGADPAAGVVQAHVEARGDIKNAPG